MSEYGRCKQCDFPIHKFPEMDTVPNTCVVCYRKSNQKVVVNLKDKAWEEKWLHKACSDDFFRSLKKQIFEESKFPTPRDMFSFFLGNEIYLTSKQAYDLADTVKKTGQWEQWNEEFHPAGDGIEDYIFCRVVDRKGLETRGTEGYYAYSTAGAYPTDEVAAFLPYDSDRLAWDNLLDRHWAENKIVLLHLYC